jgi:hypothetical protein
MDEKEEKKRGVFTLSERETTHVIVGLLLGGFLLFVSGYYLGKRRACEEFAFGDDVQFAQKVHSALNSLAGRSGESVEGEDREEDDTDENDQEETGVNPSKGGVQSYAHLCGFGSSAAAQAYVNRLAARKVGAHVAERTSTSSQGRHVTWYQVVTDAMDRNELCKVVAEIKKCDKLTDVSIIDLVE